MQTSFASGLTADDLAAHRTSASTARVASGALLSFDRLYVQRPHLWLAAILVAYLVAAVNFAVRTPMWQVPDEPAHYNYVRHIALGEGLPVLREGDYDQEFLESVLTTRFPRKVSLFRLRYESYQPPLYYLAATPIFQAFDGSLLALRLFSVVLGLVTLILFYLSLDLVFPGKTLISLGAVAFSALLPMHLAMTAAVNNDGLAELLLAAALLLLLRWMHAQFYSDESEQATLLQPRRIRYLVGCGTLIGLGMATKIYAYMLLPLSVGVVIAVAWLRPRVDPVNPRGRALLLERRSLAAALRHALCVIIPALIIALPVWIRNMVLYGISDPLALKWHDRVVAGQARTLDWITANGWVAYGERAFAFTFRSFWGVFGWMGVFMDERIYTALLLFTGALFMGLLWATVRMISGGSDTDMDAFQVAVLGLFGVLIVAVTASYLWYNAKFVQHQGRYFFWGLLPISTVVALGWRELLQPLQGVITGMLGVVMAIATVLTGYVTGGPDKWTLLSMGLIVAVLLLQPLLLWGTERLMPRRPRWLRQVVTLPPVARLLGALRALVWALPFVLLFVLDLAIPVWFIIPQLSQGLP
jgi:4-amino-4-deoxy-L-arabinose transferase-like glycosyltransferase